MKTATVNVHRARTATRANAEKITAANKKPFSVHGTLKVPCTALFFARLYA
jgi:hypothetical protein